MISFFFYSTVIILLVISLIHFYWAFGGRWGSGAVIPQNSEGASAVFKPRTIETVSVAILILIVCFILFAQSGALPFFGANTFTQWSCMFFALVFFIRAVGDFKYVGFFKKIKGTAFASYDTSLYSPLCLYLAFSFVIASN
jgi:hypothetical protein